MKLKTKFLNTLRAVGKVQPVEHVLVNLALNKTIGNFFAKAAPNNYQYPKNSIRTCERNGIRYELDISDYMQYCIFFGIENEPRSALYDLVKNGTTVIDVGTNIGETLLNFAKINRDGLNIGFEPVPFMYEKAKTNIALNEFRNIELVNKGLSSSEETLSFREVSGNNTGGTFLTRSDSTDENLLVQAIPLDDFVREKNLKNISLIKIDVEGFEMEVLKGASETLRRFKPTLFVEIDDAFLARQQSNSEAVFDFLSAHEYKIRSADTGNEITKASGTHFDIIGVPMS
ncbi:MAG: FkbM family methyltransferase [Pyrinomonadaceae bacterium]